MSAKHYQLKLTKKEFKALGQVLDNYCMDCAINTKTLAAVERIVGKIIKEATRHQE